MLEHPTFSFFKVAVPLVALCATGCARESFTFIDEGTVCVFSATGKYGVESMLHHSAVEHAYVAGVPFLASARSPGCFETGCFDVSVAECEVRLQDRRLVISSEFVIEIVDRIQCKSDCRSAEATCVGADPAIAQTYEVAFGDAVDGLVVPSQGLPTCLDQ